MQKVVVLVAAAFLAPHVAKPNVVNEDSSSNEDSISFNAKTKNTSSPSGVSAKSTKKIKMVINTLQDILQSVESDEQKDSVLYDKYMTWCHHQKNDISQENTNFQKNLGNAKVASQEQQSSIDTLKGIIGRNEQDLSETQDAMDQATALRHEENEKYNDDLQLNTQSLRQVDEAIKHVKKVQVQGGFLQNGVMKRLTLNQPGESSYVLGIMKGLKEKLEKNRDSLTKTEKEKVTMYDSLMKTKGKSLSILTDTTTDKKIALTETQSKEASTQLSIGKLTDEVASAKALHTKTEDLCREAETEWKYRQEDRTKEKAALREAIRYLKETALEQIALVQQRTENDETVVFAPSFLQVTSESGSADTNGDEDTSKVLTMTNDEVEEHLRKDTFDGIKGVVTKLIASHLGNQEEETQKREYCKKQLDSTEDEKTETKTALDTIKASIEKKQSEAELLEDEVKKLYASIDHVQKDVAEAGKIRKQEAEAYDAATKDRSLAVKILKQAMTILQSFYDKKDVFLQNGDVPPEKWKSTSKKTASYGVVNMIQTIADDIETAQKHATYREEKAIHDFGQMQEDSQADTDKKQQDITERVTTTAKLKVQINGLKETQDSNTNDLSSLSKQLDSLHKQCDELLKNYDNRKSGRTFEVSQLRDVMDIVSGSSIAARTGFVQESETSATNDQAKEEAATSNDETDASDTPITPKERIKNDDDSVSAHEAALLRSLSPQ